MTVNQKICKNIVFNTSRNISVLEICFVFWIFEEAILTNIQIYLLCGNTTKSNLFLTKHSAAFKDSLQQQIHFNSIILGTNAVVVTRVHCTNIFRKCENDIVIVNVRKYNPAIPH